MVAKFTLEAQVRKDKGKGAARAVRRENKVPAILYGLEDAPLMLALPLKELTLAYKKGGFMTKLVEITVDGKAHRALPRDIQTHPVTDVVEHVDFLRVSDKTKVRVAIPVRVINQEKSVGIKRGGVLNLVRHTVEYYCNPAHIPHHITVDVANVDIGHSVHINDIEQPKDSDLVIADRNFTVVTISGRSEEKETPAAAAAAEGAAPAAGAAAAPAAGAKAAAPAAAAKAPEKKK